MIVFWFLNLDLSKLNKFESFSINFIDLGFEFKISSVKAPFPGPISIISFPLRFSKFTIFLQYFCQ